MEEYKGGLNAFVHLTLPDSVLQQVENTRLQCQDCGRTYYSRDVASAEDRIYIESYLPEDGHCDDCGSINIVKTDENDQFLRDLEQYHLKRE